MHVQELAVLEEPPEITTEVASIDLDYSSVGPKFGSKVGEIDDGIESGEYEIDDDEGVLRVAGEESRTTSSRSNSSEPTRVRAR